MGRSYPNDQRTKILETEIAKFNDFIIGDYIDAHENDTDCIRSKNKCSTYDLIRDKNDFDLFELSIMVH